VRDGAATGAPGITAIGIDVGGSGVKGGLVDTESGVLLGGVVRRRTPDPARIRDVVPVIADVARELGGGPGSMDASYRTPVWASCRSMVGPSSCASALWHARGAVAHGAAGRRTSPTTWPSWTRSCDPSS
jgi:hypothetical protein